MAAYPTDTFTAADLAVMIPSIWGTRMNDYFKESLVMADWFTNRSDELVGGGNTLLTPGLTAMVAASKANATVVTVTSPTETAVNLVVNSHLEVSFAIEDREAAQVKRSYEIQKRYAKNAAFAVALRLETALAALFSGFSASVGASNTNLADSEIRAAIATLETSKVTGVYDGEVAFFMHPNTFWRQVQNLDKFSLAVNSPVNDPTRRTPDAHLYGIPVFRSVNVPTVSGVSGRYNVLAHKDALHWATSPLEVNTYGTGFIGDYGLRVQSSYIPDYLATITTADILFGCVENRDNAGVVILTNS